MKVLHVAAVVSLGGLLPAIASSAEEAGAAHSAAELAKKLSNPVAALISVPLQLNYDQDIGSADEGERFTLNIQPVIPVSISKDWNLISRTILSIIDQSDISSGAGSQSGIGDIVQSVFFSPKAPSAGGLIWGVGPVFLLPTASDDLLGSEQWGTGPTAVVLKQEGHWTFGALANHIWSFAGDDDRADINATFLQPFVSYTTTKAVTYSFNTETTYDWESSEASVPLNLGVAKVTRFGSQLVSLGAGVRYYIDSTPTGSEGFGARLVFTLLFPR